MSSQKYPLRNFLVPSGYVLPVISNDVYSNDVINKLYTFFSLCFGQKMTTYIENLKKGIKCKVDCKTKFLLMSLYTLRNWYNGGFIIPLPSISGTFTLNLYWEQTNTDYDTTDPLAINVTSENTYVALTAALQLSLPPGYTATLVGSSIYVQTVNQQEPYVFYSINNGISTSTGWAALDLNSCAPYPLVQQIIENCIKVCGNPNGYTLAALMTDNVYTSVGVVPPDVISGVTSYQLPDFFFN